MTGDDVAVMKNKLAMRSAGAVLAVAAAGVALSALPAAGQATPKATAVSRPLYVTKAPIVMLKDLDSGAVLFSRGTEKPFAPASMTKVMTAYVVLDLLKKGELSRDKKFRMTEDIWRKWNSGTGSSSMFLRPGEMLTVDELMKGLITVSGNDAAVLLAVGIDGSEQEFVKRMNRVAASIGMKSSRFGTASGWPDGGVTKVSAADLITLADRLIREHPDGYGRYFSIPSLRHGKAPDGTPIVQRNRNPLLGRFDGADGLKTGHTAEAGFCLLGSAKRGNRRLIMVVAGMGSEKSRRDEAERLMRWGFEQWEGRELVSADVSVAPINVDRGNRPIVSAKTGMAVRMTVPKGHSGGYRAVMKSQASLSPPIVRGTPIAELIVTPDGLPPQKTPLLASDDIVEGGWWARTRAGFYRLTGW